LLRGRLQRDRDALTQQAGIDRSLEIQPSPHGAGGGQHLLGGHLIAHRHTRIAVSPR
jgi:hypothetical protein